MSENKILKEGIRLKKEWPVTNEKTAKNMKSGDLMVFATPSMLALMESTAQDSVREYLDEGFTTVGISANIKHLSATPVGMKVYCESKLTDVDGKILTFELEAFDETGIIGKGEHKRCIVNTGKFVVKAYEKLKIVE